MRNRIYIQYSGKITKNTIALMETYLISDFIGRTVIDGRRGYIDLKQSENPNLDEVSQFILALDGTDFITFWGYPLEDGSNITTNEDFKDFSISEIDA
ncbi:hypothetical protein [Flavobacterium psychrophilum]|uniref:hypothetical protein n=1 Tax=Flavobacterium psychrophilum TaxID=96345 RepID=UPI00106C74BF|nr:hypothetical protein [Flavobacterium psychrophilum]